MRRVHESDRMKNKRKKKKNKVAIFVAVAFVGYFVYTVCDQEVQIRKYNSQIEMYQADIKNKNQLTEYYGNQKSNIQSDAYIEDVARKDLGYVKPNEKIFVDANK